jgi:hypothetical protein
VTRYTAGMSLQDSASIEVAEDTYDRLMTTATARGLSLTTLLDRIVVGALDHERRLFEASNLEHARNAREVVNCSCCNGRCKDPLRWRGTLRCGCPNTSPRP